MHLASYVSSKAPFKLARPAPQPRWKRTCDLVLCLMAMPALALTTLFVAVMMRTVSRGPVIFTQERVGYMGRRFRVFKFRTMHVSACGTDHQRHIDTLINTRSPMAKMDASDQRVYFGGRFLRATGLDELPQIVNVLRGEMSLVGPRPCLPYEAKLYTAAQFRRFQVLPGMTGLWQVSGKNRTTFDEMIALDLSYVKGRSLRLDAKIILRTPLVLLGQLWSTLTPNAPAATDTRPPFPTPAVNEGMPR